MVEIRPDRVIVNATLSPHRPGAADSFRRHRAEGLDGAGGGQNRSFAQPSPARVFGPDFKCRGGLTPRRIVAKVEHHPGELFPLGIGFIVTKMTLPSRSVVRFYNKRDTAEQWIKEGKQATNWTRLSCHRFRANEVRLQLSVLAYNLGEPMAEARAAATDQELVADELATSADQDRRSAAQARTVLLAATGGGASQPEAVRRDAGEDLGATCAGRLTRRAQSSRNGEVAERQGRSGVGRGAAGAAERLDQTRSEGWTGEERRFERESSAKNVAPRPWLAYTVSAGMDPERQPCEKLL